MHLHSIYTKPQQHTGSRGPHYDDVILGAMASQITSLTIVYSTVYSGADQKKTPKLRVTGLCVGNSPGTGEFPAQMVSNAENVWLRHHAEHNYWGCCTYNESDVHCRKDFWSFSLHLWIYQITKTTTINKISSTVTVINKMSWWWG